MKCMNAKKERKEKMDKKIVQYIHEINIYRWQLGMQGAPN